jgi:hypothetical protein
MQQRDVMRAESWYPGGPFPLFRIFLIALPIGLYVAAVKFDQMSLSTMKLSNMISHDRKCEHAFAGERRRPCDPAEGAQDAPRAQEK